MTLDSTTPVARQWPYIDWLAKVYRWAILGLIFIFSFDAIAVVQLFDPKVPFDSMNPFVDAFQVVLALMFVFLIGSGVYLAWRDSRNPYSQSLRIQAYMHTRRARPFLFAFLYFAPFALIALRILQGNYQIADVVLSYFLMLGFFGSIAYCASGYALFLINPASMRWGIKGFRSAGIAGTHEVNEILSKFQSSPDLVRRTSSDMLSESYELLSDSLRKVFPKLHFVGLADTYVDIQLCMRRGTDVEKKAVESFFSDLCRLYSAQFARKGLDVDSLMSSISSIRASLKESDSYRKDQEIKGVWAWGILDWIRAYEAPLSIAIVAIGILVNLAFYYLK